MQIFPGGYFSYTASGLIAIGLSVFFVVLAVFVSFEVPKKFCCKYEFHRSSDPIFPLFICRFYREYTTQSCRDYG